MTSSSIINKFELYVDDGSELSVQDELDLLNKVYRDVWTDRPWAFAVNEYSGAISGTTVALPTDFSTMVVNTDDFTPKAVVYVGTAWYKLVNFSSRKKYTGATNVCWVDLPNNNLVFSSLVSGAVTYDYNSFPTALTLTGSPLFPASYHDILYFLMATDDYMIQQFDKAKSYAQENREQAEKILDKMRVWDANLKINNYDE